MEMDFSLCLCTGTKTLVHTVCDHVFHRECILTWIAKSDDNDSCPTCRYNPLYDLEKYNTLLVNHPDYHTAAHVESSSVTTQQQPFVLDSAATRKFYRLVFLAIMFLLALKGTAVTVFVYGRFASPSSSSSPTEDGPLDPLVNATASCDGVVSKPWNEWSVSQERLCRQSVQEGSCTICDILEADECLCYCQVELNVLGMQYTETSRCCTCFVT
jgi:RING-H2 zinc finger domain